MFPMYSRRACLLMVLPANGIVVLRVRGAAGIGRAGIWPAAKTHKCKNQNTIHYNYFQSFKADLT